PRGRRAGMTLSPAAGRPFSWLSRQSYAGELPAGIRGEEVTVAAAEVRVRRRTRPAAQDHLVAHELPVVLAQRARRRLIPGVADVGAGGPFPHVTEQLGRPSARVRAGDGPRVQCFALKKVTDEGALARHGFPFRFRGQPGAGPAGVGIGLVV